MSLSATVKAKVAKIKLLPWRIYIMFGEGIYEGDVLNAAIKHGAVKSGATYLEGQKGD